jgi:hypothetical protein
MTDHEPSTIRYRGLGARRSSVFVVMSQSFDLPDWQITSMFALAGALRFFHTPAKPAGFKRLHRKNKARAELTDASLESSAYDYCTTF